MSDLITIKATGPLLYSVQTDKMPSVPKGKVHVQCVRYETYEMDSADFDRTTFRIHDANTPEAKLLAKCQDAGSPASVAPPTLIHAMTPAQKRLYADALSAIEQHVTGLKTLVGHDQQSIVGSHWLVTSLSGSSVCCSAFAKRSKGSCGPDINPGATMSFSSLESEILREVREISHRPRLRIKDLLEWSTAESVVKHNLRDGEEMFYCPLSRVWVAIPKAK